MHVLITNSQRQPLISYFFVAVAWIVAMVALSNQPVLALSSSPQGFKFPNRKVALVTGSNKGIGYEIAKKILSHKVDKKDKNESDNIDDENGDGAFVCILGCRNEALGRAAAKTLAVATSNACVDFVKIDLADHDSIEAAASFIKLKYGRCDVLVNNAAVCYNDPTLYGKVKHTPFAEQADTTITTNFFGTLALMRAMLPLLECSSASSRNANTPRIINIASSAGRLSIVPSPQKRKVLSSEDLTLEDLEALMTDFVETARDGKHAAEGWPNTGYGVSKVGIIAMTKIFARRYRGSNNSNAGGEDSVHMMVNSVDPGYCATDQNNNQGVIPAERGAVTPYLLATLNDGGDDEGFTGKHWYQEREIEW